MRPRDWQSRTPRCAWAQPVAIRANGSAAPLQVVPGGSLRWWDGADDVWYMLQDGRIRASPAGRPSLSARADADAAHGRHDVD